MFTKDKLCASYKRIISLGGGLDLLAYTPLYASRILFFQYKSVLDWGGVMGGTAYVTTDTFTQNTPVISVLKTLAKALFLCASLFLLWQIVLLLIGWYNPTLHLLATFSSVITVSTGNSWGIIEKIVS